MKKIIKIILCLTLFLNTSVAAYASSLQNKSGYTWYAYYANSRGVHQSYTNDLTNNTTASSHLYGFSSERTRYTLHGTYPGNTKKSPAGTTYTIKFPDNSSVTSMESLSIAASATKAFTGETYYQEGNSSNSELIVSESNYTYSIDSTTNTLSINIPSTDYWKALYDVAIEFYFNYPIFENEDQQFISTITTPTNVNYTLTETLKYDHVLTVNYVDSNGNMIADSERIIGHHGSSYSTSEKEISGYNFSEIKGEQSGVLDKDGMVVTYIYKQDIDQSYIKVHDSTLYVGDTWNSEDNFDYALDYNGNIVDYSEIRLEGTVNTELPGEYEVVYSRGVPNRSEANEGTYSAIATITVINRPTVTIKYQDTLGNKLVDNSVIYGELGAEYKTESRTIDGWQLVSVVGEEYGTFTEEAQEVVYVYERSDAADVTVRYEDSEGNQLSDPTVLSGKIGLPYASEAKEIAGWYVVETPSNASGTFSEEAQEVVYVYERSDAADVTVRYEDSEGNQLSDPTVLSGKIGLPYASEAKEIAGWYVVETPSNASGTFSEEAQEVVYVYERSDAADVTVRYEDSEGNQLSDPTVLSGKIGLPYASEAKEIAGWYVVETPSNASGTFSEEAQEVVYLYERSDAADVTVRYEDSEGNQLSDPTVLSGKIGLPYASEAKEIAGWYVVETPSNASGTFSEEAQEVVYVYERSDAADVTVRYEDSEGNQLSDPTVLSGKIGLPYASEAKEIAGWYVVETPSNASGTFSEEAQEVVYVYERSDAADVTVRYEDSEGNQLSDPTVLSGKIGLPYASEAKEIAGWYVVETPSNASGTFSEEAQEVVYVYERSDAADVTVRYEDSEGNQLSDPTVLSGKIGLPYASEAKEIAGWYVVETPSNASGTFSEEAQEVVYVYERSDAADVTVRYEDSEGNQLSDPTVLSGKIGLPYASEAKEIAGWYVVETPSNASGTFSEEAQEVVYVYERSDAADVTVRYEDSEGNQLSDPTVLSGKIGLPYASEAKEIAGWYVVETPSNASGTFSEEAQEVVYVYERSDAADVTVRYEDSEGNQLSDPTVLSGKIGLPYASEAKEIAGWYVVETPSNASGTFSEEAQEVVYVYERSDAADVTVRYEDSEGNQLSDPTVLSGKIGLPYASEAKEITGWYVVETPGNASGTFSEEAQEVVYVYERSDAADVTVRYEDSEGNQLSDPTVLSGKIGLPYASEAKEITGWYVVETPGNASGTFSEEAQEVVYVYEKYIDEKITSDGDNQNKKSKELPRTGEKTFTGSLLSFLGILLIICVIYTTRKVHRKRL
ncbi:MucBP domain-containing protein [Enterococcus sp. AZ012]|uniref:MucBP domain-containing protein n=1 Tax=unclassified Enterococcus TaxID=2608891 RepID=UPI003D2CDA37